MTNSTARSSQLDLCQRAIKQMTPAGLAPSEAAAEAIIEIVSARSASRKSA